MNIVFNRLKLRNFKNHRHFLHPLSHFTRVTGTNGAGKSTIGEAITWNLYGTDPLGNTLQKETSPKPTNYEFDYVAVELLLTVDDKQILLERRIEDGDTKYYINEVPAKATQYKELVGSLFDKKLFLSLFSPAYFFSQNWQDQRSLVLKNMIPPANSDVLKGLPKPQADKLSELLKKHSHGELESQHRENKKRQDKALIEVRGRVKALREQVDQLPNLSADDVHKLNEQMASIDAKIEQHEAAQKKANEQNAKSASLRAERDGVRKRADEIAAQYKALRENLPADHCDKCGQPLEAEALDKAKASHLADVAELKAKHAGLVEQYNALTVQIGDMSQADFDPDELRLLRNTRQELSNQIQQAGATERFTASLDEAKAKEKETEASFKNSVFVLDAIKAFRGKEAELMAGKIESEFENLSIILEKVNLGDGEKSDWFCFEMDGKPYQKLSRGEQAKVGLQVIDYLSKQHNTTCPVFFDNAESVVRYKQPAGQLIECRVVADKEFTITEVPV